jgi:hypothetical protein
MVTLSEEKIRQHIAKREAARILAENATCVTGPHCRTTPPLQGPVSAEGGASSSSAPSPQQGGGPPGPQQPQPRNE